MNENMIFQNKKPCGKRLKQYGFEQTAEGFVYQTQLLDQQFSMGVRVTEDGMVSSQIIDLGCGEPYSLHLVADAEGAFVGGVRQAYEKILLDISEKCFETEVFKSEDSKRIISYVRENYGDDLEFLWKRSPESAIWRRKDTGKWYGIVMIVSRRKIGFDADELAEVIDLRMDPKELEAVVDHIKYLPGYHMNKKHWITMCLDGSIPFEEIKKRVADSYNLAIK